MKVLLCLDLVFLTGLLRPGQPNICKDPSACVSQGLARDMATTFGCDEGSAVEQRDQAQTPK